MVVRGSDAQNLHLRTTSDLAPIVSKWRVGVGYEFLERPDGFPGWSTRYNLRFASQPKVMDLGLLYRALVDHQVDIVAGNSTDGSSTLSISSLSKTTSTISPHTTPSPSFASPPSKNSLSSAPLFPI